MEKRPPLLLLHGICNNSNLFALPEGLGHHLAKYFDIFPYNYPVSENHAKPWDFDFHLFHDMPRIWHQVCREAGCRPFVFGYSMGGMLAMVAQAHGIINAQAVVAAASPFKNGLIPLPPPLLRTWVRISALTGYRTVPIKILGRILCSVLTSLTPGTNKRRIDDLNLFRYLIRTAAVNVPVETFLQTLMWMKKQKFTDRTGKLDYLSDLANITTPVCLIYGTNDVIAPEEAVTAGYDKVSSQRKMVVSISEGTHMNMTAGVRAAQIAEVTAAFCIKEAQDSVKNLSAED